MATLYGFIKGVILRTTTTMGNQMRIIILPLQNSGATRNQSTFACNEHCTYIPYGYSGP
jgi:hypothetical protein